MASSRSTGTMFPGDTNNTKRAWKFMAQKILKRLPTIAIDEKAKEMLGL